MLNWKQITEQYTHQRTFVLVTVAKVQGSSPRETGAKMLISEQQILGTIGGGNLEFFAIQQAKEMLEKANDNTIEVHQTPLTPRYDQCCGGLVQLVFEKVNPNTSIWLQEFHHRISLNHQAWLITDIQQKQRFVKISLETEPNKLNSLHPWFSSPSLLIEPTHSTALPIYIFGTGHVGKALINQLQPLNVVVTAVDSRVEQLSQTTAENVTLLLSENWQEIIYSAPANAYFLVLTHSHKLDYQITEAILQKGRFDYCGMIGSKTKKVRFERQLRSAGISQSQLNQLTCPIGLPSITGKTPEIIAASVVAQILERHSQQSNSAQQPHQNKRIHHV